MKKIMICFLLSAMFLTGCSASNTKKTEDSKTNIQDSADTSKKDDSTKSVTDENKKQDDSKTVTDSSEKDEATQDKESSLKKDITIDDNDIVEKVKLYILTGQRDLISAEKLKWNSNFLNQVDIKTLYNQYISNGGNADNIRDFAKYITINAPISDNWQELFKKDFATKYDETIVKIEPLQNDLYQVYVEKNGSVVPYVIVSARTGDFHG